MAFMDTDGLRYLWNKIKGAFVQKENGKGLSTNDYTNAEKEKLSGIEEGANKYTHPSTSGNKHIPSGGAAGQILKYKADGTAEWGEEKAYSAATPTSPGIMSAEDKKKLDGIEEGADANQNAFSRFTIGSKSADGNSQSSIGTARATSESSGLFINFIDGHIPFREVNSDPEDPGELQLKMVMAFPVPGVGHGFMSGDDKKKLDDLPTNESLSSTYAKKSDITGMYKYMGSVTDASKLPTTGQKVGDVYNIESASSYGGAGMNVAWDGTKWDPLGEIFTITAITNAEIDAICV